MGLTSTCILVALKPNSQRGARLYSSHELPSVRRFRIVEILTSPLLSTDVFCEFCLGNERVAPMRLTVTGRKVVAAVCAYVPNISSEYPALLEMLDFVFMDRISRHSWGKGSVWFGDWRPQNNSSAFSRWCGPIESMRPWPSACTGAVCNCMWSSCDESQHL